MSSAFLSYLAAKRDLDRRALHAGVLGRAAEAVGELVRRSSANRPVRALEVGGGAGGAFPVWMRILASCPQVEFVATDRSAELLSAYRKAVLRHADETGLDVVASGRDRVVVEDGSPSLRRIEVRFETVTLPIKGSPRRFDLVLAQSFWDLLPPGSAAAFARAALLPGGLFLATLTFAGETRFGPPQERDDEILAAYHRSMGGDRGGDPTAGNRLLEDFSAAESGFRVLAEGRSDWSVVPTASGYAGGERTFLETILGFVAKETAADPAVPAAVGRAWLEARRRQLAAGSLRYRASQRDVLAERAG